MPKKIVWISLILLALQVLTYKAHSQNANESKSTTLTEITNQKKQLVIWTSNEGAAKGLNLIKSDFEKNYNTEVVVEVLNKDLTSLFKTASLTGKGPDILLWAHDVSGDLAQSGLIEPIDEVPELKNFLPLSLNAFRYKGRLYGYPYAVEAIALFYNADLVKTAPQSFEEIVQVSKKFTDAKKNKYGFLYDFKNFFFSFPLLNANGGYIFKETPNGLDAKDVGLTHEGFVQGLTFLKKLNTEGLIPTSTDRGIAFEHFKKNQLMFTIDGPWAIKDLNDSKVNYKIISFPTLNGQKPRPFVGVQGFMIRRSSQQKLLAKEFLETVVLKKKSVETLYSQDQRLPARADALADLANKNEQIKTFKESVETGIPMPNIPQMGMVWGAMGKAMSLAIDQGFEPKKALDEGVKVLK